MAAAPINQQGLFVHDNTVAPQHPSLMSMFSLKGKTAIISGAGAGIGLAVAHGLAEAGANVALWYNSNPKCQERASEIAQKYGVQGAFVSIYPGFNGYANVRSSSLQPKPIRFRSPTQRLSTRPSILS